MKNSATAAKLLFSVCLIVIFNKVSGCGPFWIRYDDRCYKINEATVTRHSAMLICNMEGGNLVSITDASILDFLSQHVSHSSHSKLWVGLEKKEDELMWFDGTKVVGNQSWVKIPESSEYTNSTADFYGSGCFAFNGTFVVKEACYHSLPFICTQHIFDHRNDRSCLRDVDANFSYTGEITGNCLFRLDVPITKDKVNELCFRRRGGRFADFEEVMKDGLSAFSDRKAIVDGDSRYWTNFAWNGTNLIRANGHAVPGDYPISVVEGSGSCITVQFNLTNLFSTKFYQTDCDELAFGMCTRGSYFAAPHTTTRRSIRMLQSYVGDNCPEGYNWKTDRSKDFCYWETSFETDQLSWNDAEKYCQGFGGHLASLHSVYEEKISLSFQYGSLAHDYWIGLTYDTENNTYKWSDGSPLNYTNWAPGHPDHKDKLLQCVSMNAKENHWTSSLCGILSWFICKVPKKMYHPSPNLPTPTPLEPCEKNFFESKSSWYFEGSCYFPVVESLSWHRAKQYCENQGGTLVSIHSINEIGFLLRLLHDSSVETNRAWIGLNSFGHDGNYKWTDWTAVDFTYFAANEPGNSFNQEKCCNMNTRDGQWNSENCNAALSFICKRINDTSVSTIIPTTQDPRIGNCKKGWIDHVDRCYYIGGKREKDRLNWTEATAFCQNNGGYLTSIRSQEEQSFLGYLLQTLGVDAWIGLHDTIHSGRYYWLDNSDLQYTNWAPGEPSFFGIMEDCVKMVYDHLDSGVWKDDDCLQKLGFICQTSKDPDLPPPPSERGLNCVHPEGWLKLDSMCFKMFEEPETWHEAELACRKDGGDLVSISDQRVKAVVSYLASVINQPFLIGLRYDKDSQTVKWLNNFPVKLADWEKNEPSFMTEDTCFASTSEGYWKKTSCDEKMPYLCQITTGKPKKLNKFVGNCPITSISWFAGRNSYCYILQSEFRSDWYTANLMCFRFASHMLSLHSMEELEDIKKLIKPGIQAIYLGLMRNKKGGFTWIDDSPVNFENWDEGEPSNLEDQCVQMMTHNMKWRVTSCLSKKHYICMDTKGTLVVDDPEAAEYSVDQQSLSTAVVCAIVFGILIIAVVIVAAVLLLKKTYRMPQFRRQERDNSVSFENAMYDVCSSSMVFNEENKS